MQDPPRRRTHHPSAREAAEAVFKPAAPKAAEPVHRPAAGNPPPRELVSLRIDRDVLEKFQEDGPGWQDRINAALRRAIEG